MSENPGKYGICVEQNFLPEIGETYYYANFVEGRRENNFRFGMQVFEILWNYEVNVSQMRFEIKLFKTRQESKEEVDRLNNMNAGLYESMQGRSKLEYRAKQRN